MQKVLNSAFSPSWHTCSQNLQDLRTRQYTDEGFENLGCGTRSCDISSLSRPIIAPMLESGQNSVYSNFWCGQDDKVRYRYREEAMTTVCVQTWFFDCSCIKHPIGLALTIKTANFQWIGALEGVALPPSHKSSLSVIRGKKKGEALFLFPYART